MYLITVLSKDLKVLERIGFYFQCYWKRWTPDSAGLSTPRTLPLDCVQWFLTTLFHLRYWSIIYPLLYIAAAPHCCVVISGHRPVKIKTNLWLFQVNLDVMRKPYNSFIFFALFQISLIFVSRHYTNYITRLSLFLQPTSVSTIIPAFHFRS